MSGNHRTPPACAGGFDIRQWMAGRQTTSSRSDRDSERLGTTKLNTGA